MRESVKIIRQAIKDLPTGQVMTSNPRVGPPKRIDMKKNMESLINHFKLYTEDTMYQPEKFTLRLRRLRENLGYI